MKHAGRGVIRIGDTTDHGGQVTGASSRTTVMGKLAALDGDLTSCPRCKGTFPITVAGTGPTHEGTPYAFDGDLTACGARLSSSL